MLRIEDFTLSIGPQGDEVEIVHDLELVLGRGETLCIVGESGSGKTVTALSIIRLLEFVSPVASSGAVVVDGVDVNRLDEAAMRRFRAEEIGMIFQEGLDSLNPAIRIGRQLVEAYAVHAGYAVDDRRSRAERNRAGAARARQLLVDVGMHDPDRVMRSYPHQLSGGMQQRVMIAMALIKEPKLLIADEPTTALDVTTQAEILRLIRDLQRRLRMSCVFITHDMGVAAEVADRIAVMYRGRLVESGPARDVLTRPRHPYSRALLDCVPQIGVSRKDGFPTIDAMLLAAATGSSATETEAASLTAITRLAPPAVREEGGTRAPALVIDHVSKRFGSRLGGGRGEGTLAVDDVAIRIEPGEFFGLVGESGSGKTTLGRMVAALDTPTEGRIEYGGFEVGPRGFAGEMRRHRRDVQMIFQDPQSSLDPRMTAMQIVAEPIRALTDLRGSAIRDRVLLLLTEVGLPTGTERKYPSQLSGGQRQRVAIARAIAASPSLIVADEPTSALDVSVQGQVMNVLLALQRTRDLSFLFITHNLGLVLAVADRIGVMQQGRLVEVGTAEEIAARPQHPYTRRLLDANPTVERALAS